jgi:hypothetical protein
MTQENDQNHDKASYDFRRKSDNHEGAWLVIGIIVLFSLTSLIIRYV